MPCIRDRCFGSKERSFDLHGIGERIPRMECAIREMKWCHGCPEGVAVSAVYRSAMAHFIRVATLADRPEKRNGGTYDPNPGTAAHITNP